MVAAAGRCRFTSCSEKAGIKDDEKCVDHVWWDAIICDNDVNIKDEEEGGDPVNVGFASANVVRVGREEVCLWHKPRVARQALSV